MTQGNVHYMIRYAISLSDTVDIHPSSGQIKIIGLYVTNQTKSHTTSSCHHLSSIRAVFPMSYLLNIPPRSTYAWYSLNRRSKTADLSRLLFPTSSTIVTPLYGMYGFWFVAFRISTWSLIAVSKLLETSNSSVPSEKTLFKQYLGKKTRLEKNNCSVRNLYTRQGVNSWGMEWNTATSSIIFQKWISVLHVRRTCRAFFQHGDNFCWADAWR